MIGYLITTILLSFTVMLAIAAGMFYYSNARKSVILFYMAVVLAAVTLIVSRTMP
jgi:hypothetical protein